MQCCEDCVERCDLSWSTGEGVVGLQSTFAAEKHGGLSIVFFRVRLPIWLKEY